MHKFCERIIYAAMTSAILSSYCQKLPSEARSRYIEKLQLISGLDPFCPSSLGKQSSILPPVDASDIVSYLVLQTSFVTAKQFKAHKSIRIIYAAMTSAILSSYCQKLPSEARSRYIEKLQLISGLDPFCPSSLGKQSSILPPVDASDIVSYLVLQTSFVTAKQFKAHKSMEAYNQFVHTAACDCVICTGPT